MRAVTVRVLKDPATGAFRKVRIHYFHRTPDGHITTPGKKVHGVRLGGAKGYIACNKAIASVAAQTKGGVINLVVHSDDPRAVTCPECLASDDHKKRMAEYSDILKPAHARRAKQEA